MFLPEQVVRAKDKHSQRQQHLAVLCVYLRVSAVNLSPRFSV